MAYKLGKVTRPDNGSGNSTVTLTATVSKGTASGTKQFQVTVMEKGLTDSQSVNIILGAIDIPSKESIMGNLELKTTSELGTAIKWTSSAPSIISSTGVVVRPANGEADATVVMTATVTKNQASESKDITCTVKPWTDAEEVQIAYDVLEFGTIKGTNVTESSIINDMNLITTGERNANISWASGNDSVINPDTGKVTRQSFTQGDATITLTATISIGDAVLYKQFVGLFVPKLDETNNEAVAAAMASLTDTDFLGTNSSLNNIINNFNLPKESDAEGHRVVQISWTQVGQDEGVASSNLALSDSGDTILATVIRPSSSEANEVIKLTATLHSSLATGDSATDTKDFVITIPKESV